MASRKGSQRLAEAPLAVGGGTESVVTEMAGFAGKSVATEMAGFADESVAIEMAGFGDLTSHPGQPPGCTAITAVFR
jgi:hypothetical protein